MTTEKSQVKEEPKVITSEPKFFSVDQFITAESARLRMSNMQKAGFANYMKQQGKYYLFKAKDFYKYYNEYIEA